MIGRLASLYRHPVKGFTPEPLAHADLTAGESFPCDRLYAVERGASGFDAAAPRFISKWRFTGLSNHPVLARAVTAYDEATGELSVRPAGAPGFRARLSEPEGRNAFAAWLADYLGEAETQPLRVLEAGGRHRFMDDAQGAVSLVNLESVRALGREAGFVLDPLRLRANLYVEGWGPWVERQLEPGARLRLGEVEAELVKPIPRCIAVHVDPSSGERDVDVLGLLRERYGHTDCGLYLRVTAGGRLCEGDTVVLS